MSHIICSLENQSSFDSLIRTNSRVAQYVHESETTLIALYVLIRYKRTDLLVIHWGNAVVFDSLNKRLIEFLFQVTGLHWSHCMFVHLKGSSSQE